MSLRTCGGRDSVQFVSLAFDRNIHLKSYAGILHPSEFRHADRLFVYHNGPP